MSRIQSPSQARVTPSLSQSTGRAAQQQVTPQAPGGWRSVKGQATPAGARALQSWLKGPEGANQSAKIIEAVVKRNDLAKALNWEAGHIKSVKVDPGTKNYVVDVQLDVLKGRGVEKNYFTAIVNGQGKVVDVPQG